jgi:3-deoxy-D-manno-octulosonic-acid transferase
MGFSPSRTLYDMLAPVRERRTGRGTEKSRPAARPQGQLAWIHAPRQVDFHIIFDLIASLQERNPSLRFLLTTETRKPEGLPDDCLYQVLPADTRKGAKEFLAHWRPDISVWITSKLLPAFVYEAARWNIPLCMLDSGAAFEAARGWPMLPGLVRGALRKFDMILSGDEATSLALISSGALRDNVVTTGVLEDRLNPLPCNQGEWDYMTKLLATRPIWLAAEVELAELESVIAAHGQAMRRAHRLLLILVPANPDWGDEFAGILAQKNYVFARRSEGEEPDIVTQVYLADTDEELGLWYRLSPITFVGQTLASGLGVPPNPFDAAALGSVVIHGPLTAAHEIAFQRLARAGASREIKHMGELAHALDTLIAPDRAAIMAHAAWQISSAGAEALEKATQTLIELLERRGGEIR